jgi:hypothetical protein
MMANLPGESDATFDAIANRFGASPLLVHHQFDESADALILPSQDRQGAAQIS